MKIRTVETDKGTYVDLDDVIIMLLRLKSDPTGLDSAIDNLLVYKTEELDVSEKNRKNLEKFWK